MQLPDMISQQSYEVKTISGKNMPRVQSSNKTKGYVEDLISPV